jgi:hypothetical protein
MVNQGATVQLVPSMFPNNYSKKLANKGITIPSCWNYNNTMTINKCNIKKYTNGQNNTFNFINKSFPTTGDIDIPLIPKNGTKESVLGTFEYLAQYFKYNKEHGETFILLAAKNWTEELNRDFVNCMFNGLFEGTTSIRLVLPKDVTKLYKDGKPRVTLYELCIVLIESKKFEVLEYVTSEDTPYRIIFLKRKNASARKNGTNTIRNNQKIGGKRTRKHNTKK